MRRSEKLGINSKLSQIKNSVLLRPERVSIVRTGNRVSRDLLKSNYGDLLFVTGKRANTSEPTHPFIRRVVYARVLSRYPSAPG